MKASPESETIAILKGKRLSDFAKNILSVSHETNGERAPKTRTNQPPDNNWRKPPFGKRLVNGQHLVPRWQLPKRRRKSD